MAIFIEQIAFHLSNGTLWKGFSGYFLKKTLKTPSIRSNVSGKPEILEK